MVENEVNQLLSKVWKNRTATMPSPLPPAKKPASFPVIRRINDH